MKKPLLNLMCFLYHRNFEEDELRESVDGTSLEEMMIGLADHLSACSHGTTFGTNIKKIMILRFGLEDGRSCTLEEVGREFGVTRERIRQLENKALKLMHHYSRKRWLNLYVK